MAEENVPAPTIIDDQLVPNTNFFSAFTTSTVVPSSYIQQLWNTLIKDTKSDSAHPFVAPPDGDLVIDFVNNLAYPEELQFISKMYVNRDRNNIHRRPQSPIHIMADDYPPDNLKFICKGGVDEYYEKYLKMTACNPRQPTTVTNEEGGKKKKALPAGKSKQPAPAKESKPVKENL
ncbi:hypothetical protein Tco_1411276 [Tanacetum coccineum]